MRKHENNMIPLYFVIGVQRKSETFMHTYNHLMETYLSEKNYNKAVKNATKHKNGNKRKYETAKYYKTHADELKDEIMEYAEYFYNEHHKPVTINDGISHKKREIIIPSMREQIIHHMVINVLKPIFLKGMYEHSYGSIPNRGALKGRINRKRKGKKVRKKDTVSGQRTIEKWIKKDPKGMKYCLKLDIKKFFDSVPHDIIKKKLSNLINDEKFLTILYTIIDVKPGDVGITIGFYTSQWFANWYLTELDHYIVDVLKVGHYIRYMDDMVIFGSNKKQLHRIKKAIELYLNVKLGLKVKDNWQVFLFDYVKKDGTHVGRQLDFMGLQFYRDRTILRKSIMIKATRKARKLSKKDYITVHDAQQMLSYLGWIDATNTYGMYLKYIKPYVDFHKLKKKVSDYQRRISQKCKDQIGTEPKVETLKTDRQNLIQPQVNGIITSEKTSSV